MAWSFEIVETHTGNRLGPAPITGFSGARSLNAGEGGSADLMVQEPGWSDTDLDWLTRPTVRTLVASWDNTPVYAGVIWKRTYGFGSGKVGLVLRDFWSLLEGRALIGPAATYPSQSFYRFGPASLSTLADRLVRQVAENNAEALDNLPVLYPAFIAGTEERIFWGYNMQTVLEGLEGLMEDGAGGPDLDFAPVWNGDRFAWQMGANPSLNFVHQVDIHLEGGASGTAFTLEEDASGIVTRAILAGEGTGTKMISAAAAYDPVAYGPQEYLTQERIYSGKRTKNRDILERWGRRTVDLNHEPVEQATLTIHAAGTPGLLDLKPGMKLNVQAPGDPWLKGRQMDMRLAGYSFSQGSSTVDLDVLLIR